LKVTSCVAVTLIAITLFVVWIGAVLLTVKSFWYTDTFSLLLLDRKSKVDEHHQFRFYDLSTNRGRFFARASLRTDIDPFRHDFSVDWFHTRIKSPSRFAENVERLMQKYGSDQRQFLGFHWAGVNPSLKSSETQWLRFIYAPIWPFLLFLAILPAGLFWWRSRWPREQRRTATRITLVLCLIPIIIALVLLLLAIINANFLGPGEKVISGTTSHAAMRPTSDANGAILKIMTYNIWMSGAYKGSCRFEKSALVREHVQQIGHLIKEHNPDLVFLQEVVMESGPGSVNQTPMLAEAAGMHAWFYGEDINQGLPFYRFISGNAILSKWPLEIVANQSLAANRSFFNLSIWTNRTLWCRTKIHDRNILLGSVHLTIPWYSRLQKKQLQQVLDFASDRPAVLAGDFNMYPDEAPIKQVVETRKFSAKLDGPFTVSSFEPHAKIDYIFAPPEWQLINHEVIQTGLSDHMPVLSTYRIPFATYPNSAEISR
jgi:endonuclease/exonuclease/phosphatase family metal-dependent hydrolase